MEGPYYGMSALLQAVLYLGLPYHYVNQGRKKVPDILSRMDT